MTVLLASPEEEKEKLPPASPHSRVQSAASPSFVTVAPSGWLVRSAG